MIKKIIVSEQEKNSTKLQTKIQPKVQSKLDAIVRNDTQKSLAKPIIKQAIKPVPNIKPIIKPIQNKPVKQVQKVVPKVVVKSVSKPALVVKPTSNPSPKSVSKLTASKPLPKIDTKTAPKPATVKMNVKKSQLLEVDSEHETYFVYLKNPLEYRRHLLEGSRKILYCLKSHQKILLIRQKKLEEMRTLKSTIRELLYLNKRFNEKLPKYNTAFLGETSSEDKGKFVQAKVPVVKAPIEIKAEMTEMERLEESLANIERKLKTLQ